MDISIVFYKILGIIAVIVIVALIKNAFDDRWF
jgi:hypothetical protein